MSEGGREDRGDNERIEHLDNEAGILLGTGYYGRLFFSNRLRVEHSLHSNLTK